MYKSVFEYITTEENNFKTAKVPLTRSKDWNFPEHIERCVNVANGWFHQGSNDINNGRPYDDLVSPILEVAFRSEGFDVKDIEPYVNDKDNYYKSFLVRKYHPQWARKNSLDTFIDDLVETSVVFGLALVKNVNNVRPEVVDLKTIAFCDQTDILAGPICIKHQYTPSEINEFRGKWDNDAIDMAIALSRNEVEVSTAGDQKVKTPGKYIEAYELRGNLPKSWIEEGGSPTEYTPQMQVICYYNDSKGVKQGITLYKGVDKPLTDNFKALKIDRVRSKGRACGKGTVETLFQPQVWNNYSAIKIKEMLDAAALMLLQTEDQSFKGKNKLSNLTNNTVMVHEPGQPLTQVTIQPQNLVAFTNQQQKLQEDARILGSASEASLGTNPTSGTPLGTTEIVTQQGQGVHEYRQGKIATFVGELYLDWILGYLVAEMNSGKTFLEELSVDELAEVAENVATQASNQWIWDRLAETGEFPTEEERTLRKEAEKQGFLKKGSKHFIEALKDELKTLPVDVFINIKGKQKDMVRTADSITKLLIPLIQNPDAYRNSGVGKVFNELLENAGFSPVNFAELTKELPQQTNPQQAMAQPQLQQGQ
jgi:hypothetical protein